MRRGLWTLLVLGMPVAAFALNPTSTVLEEGSAESQFGWSLTPLGDVNGDGFQDFAVGAPNDITASGRTGAVYIFLGRDGELPNLPDWVIRGETSGDKFGYAVASAGDLNRDTVDDFLVGAPGRDIGGLDTGRVYVFLGGSVVEDSDWHQDGDCPGARLGTSVAGGFDFNGDDEPDFAVGAPNHNCTGVSAGQVLLFLGDRHQITDGMRAFYGLPNWRLGFALAAAGDLDGDTFDDLAAGAPQTDDLNSGRVRVWFGEPGTNGTPESVLLSGANGQDLFGWDVAGVGDVNADGWDDLLVGAPGVLGSAGGVYLFQGGNTFDAASDWDYESNSGGQETGWAVDGGADFNGDDVPDLAVGQPGRDESGANAGGVLLWFGDHSLGNSPDLVVLPQAVLPTFEAQDSFGSSVAFVSMGKTNAAPLLVGAPQGDGSEGRTGYCNFVYDVDSVVPVRLTLFSAVSTGSSIVFSWDLTDAEAVIGLRITTNGSALHEGWLGPEVSSWTLQAEPSDASYSLWGMLRSGEFIRLAETRLEIHSTLEFLSANPFRERLSIAVPEGGILEVLDLQGRVVRRIDVSSGREILEWDGRNDGGRQVPSGTYWIRHRSLQGYSTLKAVRIP